MAVIPLVLSQAEGGRPNAFERTEKLPPWVPVACLYCNYARMDAQELCDHYAKEHQLRMAECDVLSADYGVSKATEDSVMCHKCYQRVPRGQSQVHSTKHQLGLCTPEERDAGRGGRAEVPQIYPVRADLIKGTQPLRKYLGELPKYSASATEELPESVWNAGDSSSERKRSIEDLRKKSRQCGKKGQLGMDALGPWAYEDEMPQRIRDILEKDGKPRVYHRRMSFESFKEEGNFASGLVPVISQLLAQSSTTAHAYLCDPAVVHIHKMKKEGAFCGYRNTQMFCSYLVNKKAQGCDLLCGRVPSIFDIQEHIEDAWDNGFNVSGRVETGGVRGTRKYIGTPEVEAMMDHLNINIMTSRYKTNFQMPGYVKVLAEIEQYFRLRWVAKSSESKPKVRMTSAPPIYFQHSGHSFTVIGFERLADGTSQLIAFDPALSDEHNVIKFAHKGVPPKLTSASVYHHLQQYRKTTKYLQKHPIFEILTLQSYDAGTPPADIYAPTEEKLREKQLFMNELPDSDPIEDPSDDSDDTL